jgi:hypothetical protein
MQVQPLAAGLVLQFAMSTTRAGATANSEGVSSPVRAERDATGHGEMLIATWMQERADAGSVC